MVVEVKPFSVPSDLDSSLLIGVPLIDEEHYELISQLDSLDNNCDAEPQTEFFSEILSQLGQKISAHFDHEEEIFKSFGPPPEVMRSHILAHNEILNQYTELNLGLMAGKVISRSDVLRMIKRWVVDHVLTFDLEIRNYIPK